MSRARLAWGMLQLVLLRLMTREKLNVLRGVEERDKHGTKMGQVVVAVYEEEVEGALRTYPVGVVGKGCDWHVGG